MVVPEGMVCKGGRPKPCHKTIETQTIKQEELYQKVTPPGDTILINVKLEAVLDESPSESELRKWQRGSTMEELEERQA